MSAGSTDCYVAVTADSGDMCCVQWLVSAEADGRIKEGFGDRLPRLKNHEILIENVYTFEKYRGNKLMQSGVLELCQLARSRGFERAIAYVRRDNPAALKGFTKAGFNEFEEIPETKFLFITRRQHK